jgi:hypothetical protein
MYIISSIEYNEILKPQEVQVAGNRLVDENLQHYRLGLVEFSKCLRINHL